jgi:hypothetical protein
MGYPAHAVYFATEVCLWHNAFYPVRVPLKIPSSLDSHSAVSGLAVSALIFGIMAVWGLCYVVVPPLLDSYAARQWVETPCVVISSYVMGHTTYHVNIAYSYDMNGKKYRSNRYDFTVGDSSARDWKVQVVAQYPPGASAVCYVNPQNPAEAVLERMPHAQEIIPIGAVFGVFGIVAFGYSVPLVRGAIRRRKFGESVLELHDAPVPLGGDLTGTLRLGRPIRPSGGFKLKLACIARHTGLSSKGFAPPVYTQVLWKDEEIVDGESSDSVPVTFTLPDNDQETKITDARGSGTFWRLNVSGVVPGVNYAARFEVPVANCAYKVAKAVHPDEIQKVAKATPEELAKISEYKLPPHSRIRVTPTARGGMEFYFGAFRNPGAAFILAVFSVIFFCAFGALWQSDTPVILTIIIGAATLVVLWATAQIWLGAITVVVEGNAIRVSRRILGFGSTKYVPLNDILEIKTSIGVASLTSGPSNLGASVYYNIEIILRNGKKIVAGSGIGDHHETQWLALEMAHCAGLAYEK